MQRLHTEISGSGEPLVLVHGLGSAGTAFKPLRPHLEDTFTVISVDLPGHGQTPMIPGRPMDPHSLALNIFEEMSHLGIENFHLAGNSLGGWIALEMTATDPTRVNSLTGLAPAGLWLNPYNARYPGTALSRFLARNTVKLAPTALHFEKARALGFWDLSIESFHQHSIPSRVIAICLCHRDCCIETDLITQLFPARTDVRETN